MLFETTACCAFSVVCLVFAFTFASTSTLVWLRLAWRCCAWPSSSGLTLALLGLARLCFMELLAEAGPGHSEAPGEVHGEHVRQVLQGSLRLPKPPCRTRVFNATHARITIIVVTPCVLAKCVVSRRDMRLTLRTRADASPCRMLTCIAPWRLRAACCNAPHRKHHG